MCMRTQVVDAAVLNARAEAGRLQARCSRGTFPTPELWLISKRGPSPLHHISEGGSSYP